MHGINIIFLQDSLDYQGICGTVVSLEHVNSEISDRFSELYPNNTQRNNNHMEEQLDISKNNCSFCCLQYCSKKKYIGNKCTNMCSFVFQYSRGIVMFSLCKNKFGTCRISKQYFCLCDAFKNVLSVPLPQAFMHPLQSYQSSFLFPEPPSFFFLHPLPYSAVSGSG